MIRLRRLEASQENCDQLAGRIFALLDEVYEGNSPWTRQVIEGNLQNPSSIYFLAEDEADRLQAFLSVTELVDELEITNIAVRPESQGQGIATSLMQQLSYFEGRLFLEVRRSNLKAQGLYKKLGFEAFHERKNYYSHPIEDAILMKKEA
ncbi:ribosomal protein S18-alanine N-acetyltransferase [Lactococcus termiticola]|nr:ribosomal protein S18-alanine N-acetyltransferase [Lactococcus termiticola]